MSKTDDIGSMDTALTRQNSLPIQQCQSFQECPYFLADQVRVPPIDQLESCLLDTKQPDKPNKESKTKETTSKTCVLRERKKRKRTRVTKNKENVESQRMVHIAVERNRRRQISDHLNTLRSLMPPSYAHRGDQASIMGGAIDFVKELEQLLVSLETQKRMRQTEAHEEKLLTKLVENWEEEEEALMVKRNMKIEVSQVRSIQNHINLKIHCQRRPGLLLRAIVAMENLRVKVLHLNISSSQSTVLYSFNLKIEEDSKIRSTGEVVAAVHQIFSSMSINEGS